MVFVCLAAYVVNNSTCSLCHQACFSEAGSLAQAEHQLEALKELCDTLSPEDAHRLAQTQLRECEKRLAAIQHQFSGDQEAPLPDTRWDIILMPEFLQTPQIPLSLVHILALPVKGNQK